MESDGCERSKMTIPDETKEKILKLANNQWTPPGVEIVTNKNRATKKYIKEWIKNGKKRHLLLDENCVTAGNRYIIFYEVAYGAICLYDVLRNTLRTDKDGIFLPELVVLGSHYGYDDKPEIFFKIAPYV